MGAAAGAEGAAAADNVGDKVAAIGATGATVIVGADGAAVSGTNSTRWACEGNAARARSRAERVFRDIPMRIAPLLLSRQGAFGPLPAGS
jgi:hypothetical protein